MRNIFLIILAVWFCFVIEYFLSDLFPPWLQPNLLLILIIFFSLYRGIRHSLLVAFLSGIVLDSFSPQLFGLNIFVFMSCAYLTTFLKMYIYESGSSLTRLLLIFIVSVLYVLIGFLVRLMFVDVNFWEMLRYVMLPQVFATTAFSLLVFKFYKKCASKLFA